MVSPSGFTLSSRPGVIFFEDALREELADSGMTQMMMDRWIGRAKQMRAPAAFSKTLFQQVN
jgi:hypothetical protein